MGGPRRREAGVELIADCSEVSLVGIVEIAKKYPALERVWKRLLGEAIVRINCNESVTSLFKIKGF